MEVSILPWKKVCWCFCFWLWGKCEQRSCFKNTSL